VVEDKLVDKKNKDIVKNKDKKEIKSKKLEKIIWYFIFITI
jgi:hypothetical protein